GGELAVGTGRVAVELPGGVAGGAAADDVGDGLGVIDGAAQDTGRHVAARRGGIGGGRQHRAAARGRYPRRAAVVAAVRIEGADQGRRIGGLLIKVIHVGQGIGRIASRHITWRDQVIVVGTRPVRGRPLQAGAGGRIVTELRYEAVRIV